MRFLRATELVMLAQPGDANGEITHRSSRTCRSKNADLTCTERIKQCREAAFRLAEVQQAGRQKDQHDRGGNSTDVQSISSPISVERKPLIIPTIGLRA